MKTLLFFWTALLSLFTFSVCEDINLEGRPTLPPDEEDVDIFDIIAKQKVVLPAATGRSDTSKTVYQGDIVLNDDEEAAVRGLGRSDTNNIAVLLWPRKLWRTRQVPYLISGHSYDAIRKIEAAMRDLEKKVCLKFRKYNSGDKAWLNIYRGSSCWANIGRSVAFGKTDVSLGPYCLSETLIQHELIHALGFFHEQSRRDRNNYVKVLKYNVSPANLYNFDITDKGSADTFGVPYDYNSIMHYTKTTWTKNGRNTMEAKNDPNKKLGGTKLTKYDILKLNLMYHCHDKSGERWTEWSDWSKCIETYRGCYRSKHRICLVESLSLCAGADEWGVQSSAQKCPSVQHCKVEPVDGFWGSWSSWSRCSKSCDRGTRTRSRSCDSPRPANGGRDCKGSSTDTERCMTEKCRPDKYFNNFNNGFGMWSNVKNSKDPLDWQRGRGRSSSTSGPESDHTDGNGWYLYVSSKDFSTHKKKATLVSEYLSGFKCISFAYCMNGKNMGSLEFFVQETNNQYTVYPPKKNGHQGKGWHHIQFSLRSPSYKKFSYRFFIEATTGIAPYSDIAIDDILIENGACGTVGIAGVVGKPSPPKAVGTSEGCKNKNEHCISWSKSGQCYLNPGYMLASCCLACRAMGKCDNDKYNTIKCSGWAKTGECEKNGDWMWKSCCKSCKNQGKCENDSSYKSCEKWAKEGHCDKKGNKEFMWKTCCAACHTAWKVKTSCSDKHDRCKEWANSGECQKNPEWMKPNCCKSCNA